MATALKDYHGPKIGQIIQGVVLADGANKVVEGVADKFRIIQSDGVLQIRSNLTPKAPFSTKQGIVADDSNLIERIEIYNESGAQVTFDLFYGFGDFVDGSSQVLGTVSISPLPAGISTAALQTTGNASLASIDGKTPALVGGAVPVTDPATEAIATQLPAALDTDGRLKIGKQQIGAQANAWNAAVVGANGTSAAIDTKDASNVSAFGNVNAATTITVQVSEDNVTFYDTGTTAVLGGASDFHVSIQTGAKYIRLKSSGAATITATIAAKS